ncbi:hypothetical protein GCM10027188_29200 [Lysobacter humi (ex Lee et al. 2017)]
MAAGAITPEVVWRRLARVHGLSEARATVRLQTSAAEGAGSGAWQLAYGGARDATRAQLLSCRAGLDMRADPGAASRTRNHTAA